MAPVLVILQKHQFGTLDAARGPSTPSLDYLVGKLLEMQRHLEAERSGSFEVNSEYDFCREFDRQVTWFRAP
jgi:hypothetical protein